MQKKYIVTVSIIVLWDIAKLMACSNGNSLSLFRHSKRKIMNVHGNGEPGL